MERTEVLQQKLEHWCAASIRALANEPSVHYRGHNLYLHQRHIPLPAPYLQLDFSTHETRQLRGVADAIALRLRHSDPQLHQALCPVGILATLVFELLEQLRTESLAPTELVGMSSNLRNRFLFWAAHAATSKLVDNEVGLLIFTLTVMAWSRVLNQAIPTEIEDVIESTRWGLATTIGADLRLLRRHRAEQKIYADTALRIAQQISAMAGEKLAETTQESDLESQFTELVNNKTLNLNWLEVDGETGQLQFGVAQTAVLDLLPANFAYQVFTKKHDKVVSALSITRLPQLRKLRAQLDKRIRQQSVNVHRVARHLSQLVSNPALSGWDFGAEEGYLDSARITRLITSPEERKLFRKEAKRMQSNCVVSILIDNSGSMNHHNETVASLADTLAKALELAGIGTEILGFTTGGWNGGKVMNEWRAAGRPVQPGRLNSLQHTVYKDFATPWRRSRVALAGLLRSDLFREGLDGEALEWAVNRIAHRPEQRKIVLVISDGSPMDTATHKANQERYLDHHLAQVTSSVEQRPDVKLCALGVGLDLSAYYHQSLAISLDDELTTKDYFAMAELLNRAA